MLRKYREKSSLIEAMYYEPDRVDTVLTELCENAEKYEITRITYEPKTGVVEIQQGSHSVAVKPGNYIMAQPYEYVNKYRYLLGVETQEAFQNSYELNRL